MQTRLIERYFFFGLLLATLVFNFLIFKPFLSIIIISGAFAVILYPIFRRLRKKMKNWLAALLTVTFFTIAILGPILGIGIMVFNQSQDLYNSITQNGGAGNILSDIEASLVKFMPEGLEFDINERISSLVSFLSSNVAAIFSATLSTLFSLFLTILSMFFFLKDGKKWEEALIRLSPLNDNDDRKIINRLSNAINGVIKGYLLIALIQGTLMGIGLSIFGVPNPALWGVLAGIGSLIPTIGTSLVAVPAVIFLLATGQTYSAIGMGIWAFAIVGWVDNLLNPIIISSRIKMPQILVLFSILGGLALMGPTGFLIGPLSVSLLYVLVSIYKNEYGKEE